MSAIEEIASKKAAQLYNGMMSATDAKNKLYSQKELLDFVQVENTKELMEYIQELINLFLIKLSQRPDTNEMLFQVVLMDNASKIKNMSTEEHMVFQAIEAAGREGIWSKTILDRTKLHRAVLNKALKSLETQRAIKSVKSVKHPTRKIYMLYHLQPSTEVTGGPWFTDVELDLAFIDHILRVIWRYVAGETFPNVTEQLARKNGPIQQQYPASYDKYPKIQEIYKFISDSGITDTALGVADIRSLCEVLVYDDKFERIDGGLAYRATWQSLIEASSFAAAQQKAADNNEDLIDLSTIETLDALSETPCGRCSVFNICNDTGPVNSSDCTYYTEWLSS